MFSTLTLNNLVIRVPVYTILTSSSFSDLVICVGADMSLTPPHPTCVISVPSELTRQDVDEPSARTLLYLQLSFYSSNYVRGEV